MASPRDPSLDREQTSYSDLDRASAGEAREVNSDSSWAQFQQEPQHDSAPTQPASVPMPLSDGDPRYATTVPSALLKESTAVPLPSKTRTIALADVMTEVRRNNRVCPEARDWQKLYEMLPDKKQVGRGWEPPPPLTGSAWAATTSIAKRMCVRDHIEWADKHGCLDAVYAFLKSLPEESWFHM